MTDNLHLTRDSLEIARLEEQVRTIAVKHER